MAASQPNEQQCQDDAKHVHQLQTCMHDVRSLRTSYVQTRSFHDKHQNADTATLRKSENLLGRVRNSRTMHAVHLYR